MSNNLGPVIKQIRRRMGMSQQQLAIRVGVSPSAICQIENRGTINPKIDLLARILYELKAPPTYALHRAGLPAYFDNPGMCGPPLIEVCEIVNAMPEGPKRQRIEQIILETARAWRDYDA